MKAGRFTMAIIKKNTIAIDIFIRSFMENFLDTFYDPID